MTYCDDVDDVDKGDSTYATATTSEDIQYIETTNEWSQWRDELAESMFTDWQLRNETILHYKSSIVCEFLPPYVNLKPCPETCLDEGGGGHSCGVFNGVGVNGGWKSDNGTFHPGYLAQLVHMMAEKLLGCQVRATTVINCRIKTLKRTFQAIAEMRGPACNGFGWNDEEKCIISKKELFDNWVRDDVRASRPSRASKDRTGSSGSKRKRGSQRDLDVEGIHLALDQTNEQLRQIAEWPARAFANDNHVRTEFFCILREMPKLTSLDRALLQRHLLSRMDDLRGFVLMSEDEREGFCRVLLRDITR
ncbi:retrotransposon protein [Cucumis melo var. makuwa]|uniref:Retrotransposon protein n=1 Tax=Cucumis melo var. makuwa TaxID=1194695 RepID=A0A5D3BQ46_CUCMM|nr:retrotransposon protein [Cucumis melo var. makuwa]TYK01891.1 retrotransposon protein [Cucumis melo var. makuwa]